MPKTYENIWIVFLYFLFTPQNLKIWFGFIGSRYPKYSKLWYCQNYRFTDVLVLLSICTCSVCAFFRHYSVPLMSATWKLVEAGNLESLCQWFISVLNSSCLEYNSVFQCYVVWNLLILFFRTDLFCFKYHWANMTCYTFYLKYISI